MTSTTQRLLMAATAAVLLASPLVWAQTSPPQGGPGQERMAQHRSEHRAEHRADHHGDRQAKLKATLKLTPAQEAAWTTYTAAHQPPARMGRPDKAEWDKLTTPQRLDKMAALKAERDTHMTRTMDATRAFYASLSPEQQKVFDAQAPMGGHRGMSHAGHHHGGKQGHGGMKHGS